MGKPWVKILKNGPKSPGQSLSPVEKILLVASAPPLPPTPHETHTQVSTLPFACLAGGGRRCRMKSLVRLGPRLPIPLCPQTAVSSFHPYPPFVLAPSPPSRPRALAPPDGCFLRSTRLGRDRLPVWDRNRPRQNTIPTFAGEEGWVGVRARSPARAQNGRLRSSPCLSRPKGSVGSATAIPLNHVVRRLDRNCAQDC